MDISRHIYDYLMEFKTSVVVPELGCFTVVDKPSEIREGVVVPPVKTVQFDSENTNDDHLFSLYIANKEKITLEQAIEEIQNFYHQNFIKKLSINRLLTIEEFGTFSLNEIGNIVFEPDDNFFKDNYGLGNAFISDNTQQQSAWNPIVPEPEPVFVAEPVQTPEASQPPQPETKKTINPQPDPDESLFDPINNARFRENTTRRNANFDRQKTPVKPTPKPVSKKSNPKVETKNSNMWLLWVLIAAAGLCVAGYYFYPTIYSMLFSPSVTTITSIADEDQKTIHVTTDETDENLPNTEIAQTIDDATDKKNALNPVNSQQTMPSTTSQTQSSTETKTPPAPVAESKSKPAPARVTSSQNTTGQGKYLLVVASLTTRSAAEKHVRKLQAEGYECEIVDAGNQRFRVSVASYDSLSEATRQADQIRSKPYCEGVWVIRR